MKKLMLTGLVILASYSLTAQRGGKSDFRHPHPTQKLSSEERATLQSKQMALRLDLSEKQQKDVQVLLAKRHAEMEAQRQSQKNDSTQTRSREDRYTHMNARLDAQLAFNRELKSILGETKFDTWRQFHKPKGYQRNPHRPQGLHQKPHRQERHGKQ